MYEFSRRGVDEEEAREYLLDEDSDFENKEVDNEPERQGLPSIS
jgi:hypothetical protein